MLLLRRRCRRPQIICNILQTLHLVGAVSISRAEFLAPAVQLLLETSALFLVQLCRSLLLLVRAVDGILQALDFCGVLLVRHGVLGAPVLRLLHQPLGLAHCLGHAALDLLLVPLALGLLLGKVLLAALLQKRLELQHLLVRGHGRRLVLPLQLAAHQEALLEAVGTLLRRCQCLLQLLDALQGVLVLRLHQLAVRTLQPREFQCKV